MNKRDIKNFTIEELKKELSKIPAQPYRARQIFFWIYKKGLSDFRDINNIPSALKEKLGEIYCIGQIKLREHLKSIDGTEKFLFELSDGDSIETVLIPAGSRKTICLSTQVGCRYACTFCASGLRGFVRNLTASEILSQILFLKHVLGHRITNFVFMGMGEPLDNYENLRRSIMIMNCAEGLDVGARRITVSSCGITPGIEKFESLELQVNLSISLHAANDKLRDSLMPVNKIYPLEKLIASCEHFIKKRGRRITIEYVLIKGKNDSLQDVKGISSIGRRLRAKVNLIPCSPVAGKGFLAPSEKAVNIFRNRLIADGVNVTVRGSKGKDIYAACGQLSIRRLD